MRRIVFLLPLLIGGCSCQPDSAREPAAPAPQDMSAASSAAATDAAAEGVSLATSAALSAVAPGALDEPTTVRNYVYALMGADRAASDAYWTGGRTGSRPDDQVLRVLPGLQTLRVDTELPIARDTAQPSRLREVPVRVRAVTADGTLHYHGWYRLQPRADGSGWEITSASLQPTLR